MRGKNGLVLVGAMAFGILLGVLARGGIESVSKASPSARGDSLSGADRVGDFANVALRSAGVECNEETPCDGDDLCYQGQCYETCDNAADCTDDGLECTDASCGPVDPGSNQTRVCTHVCGDQECPPPDSEPTATHTIMTELATVENARAIGVWGTCEVDEVPEAECVFTVDSVQYTRSDGRPTKFNAVCVDLDAFLSIPAIRTCSPMERESLAFGVSLTAAPGVGAHGGVAAALFASGQANFGLGAAFTAPFLIHRRFRYPQTRAWINYQPQQADPLGKLGGNILIDSGLGSISAAESVIFSHTDFTGSVRFIVSKPRGMALTLGYTKSSGDPICVPGPCPFLFSDTLVEARQLGAVGVFASSTEGDGEDPEGDEEDFASDFDIEEVVEALNNETQAIQDIRDELKGEIQDRISEQFDILREFLDSGNTSSQSVAECNPKPEGPVEEMMCLLRQRISADLEEIRGIARDLVACPNN